MAETIPSLRRFGSPRLEHRDFHTSKQNCNKFPEKLRRRSLREPRRPYPWDYQSLWNVRVVRCFEIHRFGLLVKSGFQRAAEVGVSGVVREVVHLLRVGPQVE